MREQATCATTNGFQAVRGSQLARRSSRPKLNQTRTPLSCNCVPPNSSKDELLQKTLRQTAIEATAVLRPSGFGQGLYASQDLAANQVFVRVPKSLCLVVDYKSGQCSLPAGSWPRLKKGLQKSQDLAWDLLLGLALLDALSGDGNNFWETYANDILPSAEHLALPFCLPEALLEQLEHKEIIQGARQQQQRLRLLFPGLSHPIGPGLPSWFQWAFANVRSRSLRLGDEVFGIVPVVDLCNHAAERSADFRVTDDHIECFAVRDIASGEEATVSYTGCAGYTNQRLMAQYGFVPEGGNAADRIDFEIQTEYRDLKPAGGGALSLQQLQRALGDAICADMLNGSNLYLYAAAKSMPLHDASTERQWPAEVNLARDLLKQCKTALQGSASSLEDDELLLESFKAPTPDAGPDVRKIAVVQYRLERKRLLSAAKAMLHVYISKADNSSNI